MSIAFWQVVIVLGVVVFIFSRKSILKGIKDFIRGLTTPKHVYEAEEKLMKEYEEQERKEKERQKEEERKAREEEIIEKEGISGDLGASLKRLKKMYNEGHLSKVEFEKAKNKLLK